MSYSPKELCSKELVVADEVVDAEVVDEPTANPHKSKLLSDLRERRERMMDEGQIDNSTLYAGDPLYYYCKFCGVQTDVKPENWFLHPPKATCGDCDVLI